MFFNYKYDIYPQLAKHADNCSDELLDMLIYSNK